MKKTWTLQDAKSHLSELVREARSGSPQEITLRGKSAVMVLSTQDYETLRQSKKPGLVAFLKQSPLSELELDIER